MGQLQHIVVMGVAGSGKSTLATALGAHLGWAVDDADVFHPQTNIDKMAAGVPLSDVDRAPWLAALVHKLRDRGAAGQSSVLACSSLKRVYRDQLRTAHEGLRFILLHGCLTTLEERLRMRKGHYFPSSLLETQLAALEPLAADENGIVIGLDKSLEQQVQESVAALGLLR